MTGANIGATLGDNMVTIVELHYPNETLWGVEYNGKVISTSPTRARAEEVAQELFGALE